MDEYCKTTGNEQTETEAIDKILFYSSEGTDNITTQSVSNDLEKVSRLLSKLFSDNDECESEIDNANVNIIIYF